MSRFLLALIIALTPTTVKEKSEFRGRVFPKASLANPAQGCSSVLLTVEIVGPEREDWYCPGVEWIFPDRTRASEVSDCAPFEERDDYPRVWRRRLCAPPHPRGDEWTVEVRLTKGTDTLVRTELRFYVK